MSKLNREIHHLQNKVDLEQAVKSEKKLLCYLRTLKTYELGFIPTFKFELGDLFNDIVEEYKHLFEKTSLIKKYNHYRNMRYLCKLYIHKIAEKGDMNYRVLVRSVGRLVPFSVEDFIAGETFEGIGSKVGKKVCDRVVSKYVSENIKVDMYGKTYFAIKKLGD